MSETICPLNDEPSDRRLAGEYTCPCAMRYLLRNELDTWVERLADVRDHERALVHTRAEDAKMTQEELAVLRASESGDYETPDGWTRTETEEFELSLILDGIDHQRERMCHICRYEHAPIMSYDRRQLLLFDLSPYENDANPLPTEGLES